MDKMDNHSDGQLDWNQIQIPSLSKLFYVHQLLFIHQGHNYTIEIQEYSTQKFMGFMESALDKSGKSYTSYADTLEECLQKLISSLS